MFADDYGHVCHFKNFDKFKTFSEVSDVVNKKVNGRNNDNERILAYNIGVSIHDINFASKIYKKIIDEKIDVREFDVKAPIEKYWI